jgi:hypothetical protein
LNVGDSDKDACPAGKAAEHSANNEPFRSSAQSNEKRASLHGQVSSASRETSSEEHGECCRREPNLAAETILDITEDDDTERSATVGHADLYGSD